jgi:hypothetical protein
LPHEPAVLAATAVSSIPFTKPKPSITYAIETSEAKLPGEKSPAGMSFPSVAAVMVEFTVNNIGIVPNVTQP